MDDSDFPPLLKKDARSPLRELADIVFGWQMSVGEEEIKKLESV